MTVMMDYIMTMCTCLVIYLGGMKTSASPRAHLLEVLKPLVEEAGSTWDKDLERAVPRHWEKHGDLVLLPMSSLRQPVWQHLGEPLLLLDALF